MFVRVFCVYICVCVPSWFPKHQLEEKSFVRVFCDCGCTYLCVMNGVIIVQSLANSTQGGYIEACCTMITPFITLFY
jgi:hypothetical protein